MYTQNYLEGNDTYNILINVVILLSNYHRLNSVINTFVWNMRWFCKLYSFTRCKHPCRLFENNCNCLAIIYSLLENSFWVHLSFFILINMLELEQHFESNTLVFKDLEINFYVLGHPFSWFDPLIGTFHIVTKFDRYQDQVVTNYLAFCCYYHVYMWRDCFISLDLFICIYQIDCINICFRVGNQMSLISHGNLSSIMMFHHLKMLMPLFYKLAKHGV